MGIEHFSFTRFMEVMWGISERLDELVKAVKENTQAQLEISDAHLRAADNMYRQSLGLDKDNN